MLGTADKSQTLKLLIPLTRYDAWVNIYDSFKNVKDHIIVTFALAAVVFIGVTILGFMNHGIRFFTFFYIPGVPFYMHPQNQFNIKSRFKRKL